MGSYRFGNVYLVLAEPNRDVRASVKTWLRDEGFRDIYDTDRWSEAVSWVADTRPDLLVADIALADGDMCDLFTAIRHHRTGENPFVPIIAVSASTDRASVRRVIDSGADDLLAKPISTDRLFERIMALIRNRKPFVVTSDYIGPDRRNQSRSGEEVPLIEVPNTLQAKATGALGGEALERQITAAVAEVNHRKMERDSFQILWLVVRIVEGYSAGGAQPERAGNLRRLLLTVEDLGRRMIGTPFAHVSHLCRSLIQVTEALMRTPGQPDPRDVRLLPHLAEAIRAAFAEGDEAAMLARDISRSVATLASR